MSTHKTHPWPRAAVIVCGLLAFAIGSNNCILGASRGDTEMACHARPADQPAADCCHGPTPGTAGSAPSASTRSCCIEPAPLPTPLSLAALPDVSPASLAILPEVAVPASWVEGDSALGGVADRPPPELTPPAPLSSRAPPLA